MHTPPTNIRKRIVRQARIIYRIGGEGGFQTRRLGRNGHVKLVTGVGWGRKAQRVKRQGGLCPTLAGLWIWRQKAHVRTGEHVSGGAHFSHDVKRGELVDRQSHDTPRQSASEITDKIPSAGAK